MGGALSDSLFRGRRAPVMVLAAAGAALCAGGLVWTPGLLASDPSSNAITALVHSVAGVLAWALSAVSGGAVWAPQDALVLALSAGVGAGAFAWHVLAGLLAREMSPPSAREVAGGLVKGVGQVGAAVGAAPLAALAGVTSWSVVCIVLCAACVIASVATFPIVTTDEGRRDETRQGGAKTE